MNSTRAVSQQPIAAGEAAADRPRGAKRDGGAGSEGGGFLQLVAKLAQTKNRLARGDTSPAREIPMSPSNANRPKPAGGPSGEAVLRGEPALAGALDAAATEHAQASQPVASLSQLLDLAGTSDTAAIAQLLAASGLLTAAADPAGVVFRFATGTATDADLALVRTAMAEAGNAETVADAMMRLAGSARPGDQVEAERTGSAAPEAETVAEATRLVDLARPADQAEARQAGTAAPQTVAKVVVLGRETHLATVPIAAAGNGQEHWAAALAASANRANRPPVQQGPDAPAIPTPIAQSVADAPRLADLTRPADQAEAGRAGIAVPETVGKAAVPGRQTQPATVPIAAASNGQEHWAAALAASANRANRPPVQQDPDTPAATTPVAESVADAPRLADPTRPADQADQAEAGRAGTAAPETVGKAAVPGRQTQPATVPSAAASNGQVQWAAALVANANRTNRPAAQQDADTPASATLLRSSDALKLEARLANPQAAMTAGRDVHLGTHSRSSGSLMHRLQTVTEAMPATEAVKAVDGMAAGAEMAPTNLRADALANSAATPGVAQQIVDRVAAEAGDVLAPAGRAHTRTLTGVQPSGSPVKVIYIQLQPADLGTITIRMSVKEQALQLDLEVGRGETAHLIQRERETLSAQLRSAGYAIDGVDVRMAGPSGVAAPAGNNQTSMQMPGDGQSRGSDADGKSSGAGAQDDRRHTGSGHERNRQDEQARRSPRGSGLYV